MKKANKYDFKNKKYVAIKEGNKIDAINCSIWQVVKFWILCQLTGTTNKIKELK